MLIIQIITVLSTAHESLEITGWVNPNKNNVKQVEKEMLVLVNRLYSRFSRKSGRKKENTMMWLSKETIKIPAHEARKLANKIHYTLYKGSCLDPKKLAYFMPEKTTEEGDIS